MDRRKFLSLTPGIAAGVAGIASPVAASTHDHPMPQLPQDPGHYHEGDIGEKLMLVEQSLKCSCGCGLDVHSCQFTMQCDTSPAWSRRIRASLEAGQSVEEVQAAFVEDYGLTVLMAPPARGFNLLGYLLPSIAIVTAGMLVGLIAKGRDGQSELAPIAQPTDEQSARLEAALKRLDETEGPDW